MSLLKIEPYQPPAPLAIPPCFQPFPAVSNTFEYWRFKDGSADAAATAITGSFTNVTTGTPIFGPLYRTCTPGNFSNDDNTQSLEFNWAYQIVEILRGRSFQRDAGHQ